MLSQLKELSQLDMLSQKELSQFMKEHTLNKIEYTQYINKNLQCMNKELLSRGQHLQQEHH